MKLSTSDRKNFDVSKYRIGAFSVLFLFLGIFLGMKNVPGFLKANLNLLNESRVIDALTEKNDLITLQLDMPFKSFKRLKPKEKRLYKRKTTVPTTTLLKPNFKDGITSRCRIRLKGDLLIIGLETNFLRVEMKGVTQLWNESFLSSRSVTRTDTEEWLFQKH